MGTTSIFIICLLVFGIGIIVGGLLFKEFSPEQKKARNIIKHLHEQQDEFKNYQLQVTQSMTISAELLNQLLVSYNNIHNHVAKSAEQLGIHILLSPITLTTSETDSNSFKSNLINSAPPLDYAPKSTPYDRGTLNEEYGLEKIALNQKPSLDSNKVAGTN